MLPIVMRVLVTRTSSCRRSQGRSTSWSPTPTRTGDKNYLVAVWPKLSPGGCFTAHNVSGRGAGRGIGEFLAHLKTLPDAVTEIDTSSRAGVSISCKR